MRFGNKTGKIKNISKTSTNTLLNAFLDKKAMKYTISFLLICTFSLDPSPLPSYNLIV